MTTKIADIISSGEVVGPLVYGNYAAINISLGGLTNGSYRQSDYVDNSGLLYIDALVGGHIRSGGSAPTAGTSIVVYTYGYTGTEYTAGASGTDSAYTADGEQLLFGILKSIQVTADTARYYVFGPCSVADSLGLRCLPSRWGIVVVNGIGQALDATNGNHVIGWYGVK